MEKIAIILSGIAILTTCIFGGWQIWLAMPAGKKGKISLFVLVVVFSCVTLALMFAPLIWSAPVAKPILNTIGIGKSVIDPETATLFGVDEYNRRRAAYSMGFKGCRRVETIHADVVCLFEIENFSDSSMSIRFFSNETYPAIAYNTNNEKSLAINAALGNTSPASGVVYRVGGHTTETLKIYFKYPEKDKSILLLDIKMQVRESYLYDWFDEIWKIKDVPVQFQ